MQHSQDTVEHPKIERIYVSNFYDFQLTLYRKLFLLTIKKCTHNLLCILKQIGIFFSVRSSHRLVKNKICLVEYPNIDNSIYIYIFKLPVQMTTFYSYFNKIKVRQKKVKWTIVVPCKRWKKEMWTTSETIRRSFQFIKNIIDDAFNGLNNF